jgi:hypothetical protein
MTRLSDGRHVNRDVSCVIRYQCEGHSSPIKVFGRPQSVVTSSNLTTGIRSSIHNFMCCLLVLWWPNQYRNSPGWIVSEWVVGYYRQEITSTGVAILEKLQRTAGSCMHIRTSCNTDSDRCAVTLSSRGHSSSSSPVHLAHGATAVPFRFADVRQLRVADWAGKYETEGRETAP